MGIFFKIIATIAYISFGLIDIIYTYAYEVKLTRLSIFGHTCAMFVFIAGPLLVWGFLGEV